MPEKLPIENIEEKPPIQEINQENKESSLAKISERNLGEQEKGRIEKLMEKIGDYKRAIAFTTAMGALSSGIEAVKPYEAYAEFQKQGQKIESVKTEAIKVNESKEIKNKDGRDIHYYDGEAYITVGETEEKNGEKIKVNMMSIKVKDKGSLATKEDDNSYSSSFTRYSDGKEEFIFSDTNFDIKRSIDKNPYREVLGVTSKMLKSGNTELARQAMKNSVDAVYLETLILKALKDIGKSEAPEYKYYENQLKRAINGIKERYGDDAIHEEMFDKLIK